jgi:hypothetical protein
MSRFIRRPSPATILSLIALTVASSGTAIAASSAVDGDHVIKKDTLSGNRLRNHTLTGAQINVGKLGVVPHAALANVAATARSAMTAQNAAHATTADTATTANGLPALQWTTLTLTNGWKAYDAIRPPAVAVDAEGVVHFRGAMYGGNGGNAFTLPAQMRAAVTIYLTADTFNGTTGRIYIASTGNVFAADSPSSPQAAAQFTSLDGITYAP